MSKARVPYFSIVTEISSVLHCMNRRYSCWLAARVLGENRVWT